MDAQGATTLAGISTETIRFLEKRFLTSHDEIEAWFANQWQLTKPPVYGSVDLRNAGFKLAPIDMNLFPAGFNNLNPDFLNFSVNAAEKIIQQLVPHAKKVLIVPENHTRNRFYWENIKVLQTILAKAGLETRLGLLDASITVPADSNALPLTRQQDLLCVSDFVPDMILLNNDLSEGIPLILQNLKQPLLPPAELGWSQRFKSEHFQYYANVVAEFSNVVQIDPWLIAPLFQYCGEIDFMQQEGMDCLLGHAEKLFTDIHQKYTEYNITQQPFLIIKADAGTYGMAVMTVRNIDELKQMNRKQRTHMAKTKGGQPVRRVIIQEGVYTFETWGQDAAVAEPVVYLWGSCVVGGFYRVHTDRGIDENLNTPGMRFEPIAFPEPCDQPKLDQLDTCRNRFYLYGIIAKLSMLAAAREISVA